MSLNLKQKAYKSGLLGICQMCGCFRDLCLDHCHTRELARGFVCRDCNALLYHVDKDPEQTWPDYAKAYYDNPPLLKYGWVVKNLIKGLKTFIDYNQEFVKLAMEQSKERICSTQPAAIAAANRRRRARLRTSIKVPLT